MPSPHSVAGPVFGVTGWKNSGKTTLVAELVSWFSSRGLKVATIKHAHCDFDIDRPGSDSFRHRAAGAQQVLLASNKRWALMHELDGPEPELEDLLQHLAPADLVLIEGFKMGPQPKLQVVRPEHNTQPLSEEAQPIVAIASDTPVDPADYQCDGPCLPLNDIATIARFIAGYCGLTIATE